MNYQSLLPVVSEIPHNEKTEPFWSAISSGNTFATFSAILSLFSGEHRHTAYKMAAAITGAPVLVILRQPFYSVCRELMKHINEDFMLFCYMVACYGTQTVARALYLYRPSCIMAIPQIVQVDRENQAISLYACDILRAILCLFSDGARELPTIRELINKDAPATKRKSSEFAESFVDTLISTFRGGQDEQQT